MKSKKTESFLSFMGWIVLLLILGFILPGQAQAQYTIRQSVFGSGGGIISGSSNRINGTAGQPFIGVISNSSGRHYSGFWYTQRYILTDVEQELTNALPTDYRLEQNYPNPFNPATIIEFAVPEPSKVSIKIYNILGEEITTIFEEIVQAGLYKVNWTPSNLSSGFYIYRMIAKSIQNDRAFTSTKKIIYMK